jgi:hypothetical protein
LLTVFQSGFCRHHSTTAAVLKITEDIRSNREDGQVTVLELLDFSQAFDMIIHGLLLCKLKSLQNYSDGTRMLVDSYLNGRTQFVRCGEKESSYINDVSRVIKFSRFHIYVDDLQIYHSSSASDLQRCYDEINMDMQQIHE